MCTAAVHDVFASEGGAAQWEALVASENERIAYAPTSEMTEEMSDVPEGAAAAEAEAEEEEDDGDDEDDDDDDDDDDDGVGGA